jgi:hypothetical protein
MKPRIYFLILILFSPYRSFGQIYSGRIQPSPVYPQYWNYQSEDILLLGGSVDDNLFQLDTLEQHLDLLVSVGGNYVRNTMSSRDPGNVWPFAQTSDGRYDLNQFNRTYWNRFENFLKETAERKIIVQIEVWATFDFYRDNWEVNPYNPKNNINYDEKRSKLPLTVPTHPIYTENDFFRSVPSQMNLAPVLWYQKKFVDKLLSYSLNFDHVLYCMDNETSVTSDWGKYWATYIQKSARLLNQKVETTEMWDPHDLAHPMHFETFDNPEIFSFVDISQNNHQGGDHHWNNGLQQLQYLQQMGFIRPANNVKIYGSDEGPHQTTQNAIESFCRNILFGSASARFHRPPTGQGLNQIAQHVIKSMRMVEQSGDFFSGKPANELLSNREENEAFCRKIGVNSFIIYFPSGGQVNLQVHSGVDSYSIRWLKVLESSWKEDQMISSNSKDDKLLLETPSKDHWIGLVTLN